MQCKHPNKIKIGNSCLLSLPLSRLDCDNAFNSSINKNWIITSIVDTFCFQKEFQKKLNRSDPVPRVCKASYTQLFLSLNESVLLNESLECMIRWFTHINSAHETLRNESVFWRNDSKTNFRNFQEISRISLVPPTGVIMSPAERSHWWTLSQANSNCSIRYLQVVVNK